MDNRHSTKEAFAMTSIAQISENEQREIEGTLKKFFSDYRVGDLLKACRAEKQKGHSAFEIFRYLLCLVFCDRSMYMQIMTGRYSEASGKNQLGKTDLSAISKNHQQFHPKANRGRTSRCIHHR